jgi:predicted Ser/Thr protein kinase
VFVVLTLATVVFFAMGIPLSYDNIVNTLSYDIETITALRELGISNEFYATYQISLTILVAIGFGVAGIIIYWHKSDEWLALLMAFTLIGNGADAFDSLKRMEIIPQFTIPVHFIQGMVLLGLLLACYLFPDGKFQKRWMVYLAGFWATWLLASTFWQSLPMNAFDRTPDGRLIFLLYLLGVLGTGIYAQIYRYRNTDNPVKREQLKWLVFGVVVSILVGVGTLIFDLLFDRMNPSDHARLIERMITQALSVIGQLTAPIAIVFAMLRYRLYDIELVINRSLIFGILTTVLGLVFAGILFGLQAAFRAITGNANPPPVGIAVATLVVFSLFNPALRISRDFVNKKIFGIEFDFSEVKRQNAKIEKVSHLPVHAVGHIGEYTGLELVARGGMGEIYKANHPKLDRSLAIKVLSSYFKGDPDFNKRFAREAEMMAKLKHPNIINIYDYGEQDGLPYIVMEYLTGETLSHILDKRERLTLDESLPLLRDIASALDYAHEHGVVHRDIKASNVIVEPISTLSSNRTHRAVLMDFGIARFTSERTRLTMTGDMLGTADYISPEQIHGEVELDGRADQYSLGVLAYLMLTGKKPFERNNTWAMIKAHLEQPAPDPREIVAIPETAAKAVMKALAKKPEDRFASIGEFVERLGK